MAFWTTITALGDAAVMVPMALAIATWLYVRRTTRSALLWIGLFVAAALLVTITKVAFIGFGLGIHPIDFTGISGHSMMSMAVLPLAVLLVAGDTPQNRKWLLPLGAAAALLIAISRVKIGVHSPSEAAFGTALGGATVAAFLTLVRQSGQTYVRSPLLSIGLILLIATAYGRTAPTHDLVTRLALKMSGHTRPFTREEWHSIHQPRAWLMPQTVTR